MAHPTDLAMAAEDPRLLPRWHFAVIGCLVTLALLLVRSHVLFLLLPGVGLLPGLLLAHRRGGYAVAPHARSAVVLRSPLPGTMAPVMIAVALWLVAASVVLGSFGTHVPPWAVVVIACTVGVVAAVLLRRSELLRIAGTRHLEDG